MDPAEGTQLNSKLLHIMPKRYGSKRGMDEEVSRLRAFWIVITQETSDSALNICKNSWAI